METNDNIDREKYFTLFSQFQKELENKPLKSLNSDILIVDFLNAFIRSFNASPAMNNNGEHIGGITGALYSIGEAIRRTGATRCIIVSDGENGSARRRKLYPEYKLRSRMKYNLNRAYNFKSEEEEDRARKLQLARLVDYLKCLPVQFVNVTGVEADDAIAYIVNDILNKPDMKITIMSSDKDYLQLVDDRVSLWSPTKKKLYTPSVVKEEYCVSPKNFLFYKMLMGDPSDNIPGVEGCGKVTIPKYLGLLSEDVARSVDEVLQFVDVANSGKKKKKFYSNISASRQQLVLNEQLMQLYNPYIVEHSKLEISRKVKAPIQQLNRQEIHLMYIHDGLSNAIANIETWLLSTFSVLNAFALNTPQSEK
jgi:DNA polymerase-1